MLQINQNNSVRNKRKFNEGNVQLPCSFIHFKSDYTFRYLSYYSVHLVQILNFFMLQLLILY